MRLGSAGLCKFPFRRTGYSVAQPGALVARFGAREKSYRRLQIVLDGTVDSGRTTESAAKADRKAP